MDRSVKTPPAMTKRNHSSPLVTVIMATYNRTKLLPKAVDSILNQTMVDFEFIIVDDGSIDNTPHILKQYQQQDKRIIILRQSNSGLASARNTALRKARGKYITFMDDDDVSHPDRLQQQVSVLQKHSDVQVCICKQGPVTNTIKSYQQLEPNIDFFTYTNDSLKEVPRPPVVLNATLMMHLSSLLQCCNYRTFFSCAEDYDLTLRFQEQFKSMANIPYTLYYRHSPIGRTTITKRNFIHIMEEHLIAHISAWYRRNNKQDPVSVDAEPNNILKLLPKLPANTRKHLWLYVERCVGNIHRNKSSNERTPTNIAYLNNLIDDMRPGLGWAKYTKALRMKWRLVRMSYQIRHST